MKYYVFAGQHATTGTPNRITGNYSIYGDVHVFHTHSAREAFVNDWRVQERNPVLIKGGKAIMRGYCLGMSVRSFEEYINNLD